jgi:hypothetical protein
VWKTILLMDDFRETENARGRVIADASVEGWVGAILAEGEWLGESDGQESSKGKVEQQTDDVEAER